MNPAHQTITQTIFPLSVSTGRALLVGGQFEISLNRVKGLAFPVTFGRLRSSKQCQTGGALIPTDCLCVLSVMTEGTTLNSGHTALPVCVSLKNTPEGMGCTITGLSSGNCHLDASAYFLRVMDSGTYLLRVIKTGNFAGSTWALLATLPSILLRTEGCMGSVCGHASEISKE